MIKFKLVDHDKTAYNSITALTMMSKEHLLVFQSISNPTEFVRSFKFDDVVVMTGKVTGVESYSRSDVIMNFSGKAMMRDWMFLKNFKNTRWKLCGIIDIPVDISQKEWWKFEYDDEILYGIPITAVNCSSVYVRNPITGFNDWINSNQLIAKVEFDPIKFSKNPSTADSVDTCPCRCKCRCKQVL